MFGPQSLPSGACEVASEKFSKVAFAMPQVKPAPSESSSVTAYETETVGKRMIELDFTSMNRCDEGCVAATPKRFVNGTSSGHSALPTPCGPRTPRPIASLSRIRMLAASCGFGDGCVASQTAAGGPAASPSGSSPGPG